MRKRQLVFLPRAPAAGRRGRPGVIVFTVVSAAILGCQLPLPDLAAGRDAAAGDSASADGGDGAAADAGGDVGVTGDGDAGGARCAAGSGSWKLGAIEWIAELSSPLIEGDPFLDADGLTIYFASTRDNNQWDTFQALRSGFGAKFGGVSKLAIANSSASDVGYSLSDDRLTAFISSNRGGGGVDLYRATREKPGDALSGFSVVTGASTSGDDYDARLSSDGARLYYSIFNWPGRSSQDIALATASGGGFSAPQPLAGVNSDAADASPSLTRDERLIVFASDRSGGAGGNDLWYATRSVAGGTFNAPAPMPVVNGADEEREPFISGDGCELFFASDRGGGLGHTDLYRVEVLARP